MSYSESTMVTLGETNAGWGVCGFTSCMYAMYELNPTARPFLINAPQAWSVVYEIQEYLETLQQKGENALIASIEEFTKTFNGFSDFTVAKYLKYIEDKWTECATPTSGDMNAQIQKDAKFSIGMPPHAVVDYLKRMWNYNATARPANSAANGIVGVYDPNDPNMKLYGGLRHYLYQKGNKVYSWGDTFNTVLEAGQKKVGRNYHVCYMITF